MRIALVSQEYPPQTAQGGIGTQTWAKAHGLARFDHDVSVISHSVSGQRHESDEGGVRLIRIPGLDGSMPLHTSEAWWLTYSTAVAVELTSLHRRSPLDLVEFPEYGAEGFAWLLNRAEGGRVPAVVHLHGPLVMLAETIGWPAIDSEFYRVGTFMEGTCIRLADAVISSSQCSADWCARAYGIRRETIDVIHTGVDTEHFHPRNVDKADRPTIIFVGRVSESKGVSDLVEAARRLALTIPGLRLRLIGRVERSYSDWILGYGNSGGHDLVDIVGFVSRDELPPHLSRAHVFAAPSHYEGGPGFVYLEAMACGLPVVACSGSGASEIVLPGENGVLVPPHDPDALTHALGELLRDPVPRAAMGKRARAYAVERADSRDCLSRLETFYRSVAARAIGPGQE